VLASEYEARANKTGERAYLRPLDRFLKKRNRVIELGRGSTDLLDRLGGPLSVAYDLSAGLLRMRPDCNWVQWNSRPCTGSVGFSTAISPSIAGWPPSVDVPAGRD
jgi:hypothetical protein